MKMNITQCVCVAGCSFRGEGGVAIFMIDDASGCFLQHLGETLGGLLVE